MRSKLYSSGMGDFVTLLQGYTNMLVWDALVVAVIFAASVFFAFTLGRHSIVISFVAVLFAALIVTVLPSLELVPYLAERTEGERDVLSFIVITLLTWLILRRNRFFEPYVVPTGIERLFFAIALAGLIVVILGVFVGDSISTSSEVTQVFLHPLARLGWFVAPIILMAFFRGNNA